MKLLVLIAVGYFAYRVLFPPKKEVFIDKEGQITEIEDGDFSDYEEIE